MLSMSTRLLFRVPRWPRWLVIFDFYSAYTVMILNYIYAYTSGGEIETISLMLSIRFFVWGYGHLSDEQTVVEPRLSRRVSIALVTIGLCLYAPVPFLVLQGYLRLIYRYPIVDPVIDLAFVVILALALIFLSIIRLILYYKKIPVTET